ncbi:MAG TPA: hypothetical protein VMT54_20775 [Candidatus Cybelea sp.]|nr:hypothetical protein [Candidatus Cybelea sp.]
MTTNEIEGKIRLCGRAATALAFGLLAIAAAGARGAAADDAKDSYEKYYEAIQVKTLCEDSGAPDAKTMEKISAYIASENKFSMTAGESLSAIQEAKSNAQQMVKDSGCDDRAVQQLITLYHSTEAAAQ